MNLIGKNVEIKFKESPELVRGLVLNCDERMIQVKSISRIIFIPMANIQYITELLEKEQAATIIDLVPQCNDSGFIGGNNPLTNIKQTIAVVKVYVDDDFIVEVDMPPGLEIASWSNDIMAAVLVDQTVQKALENKIQKDVHYSPGEIYFTTKEAAAKSNTTFSMNLGSPAAEFLDPSQMVARLNKMGGKHK